MTNKASINKVLVVLGPDRISDDRPQDSALLKRAVSLAKATGCELELFHVLFESSLEDSLFRAEAELERGRKRLADSDATYVAGLATHLRREGVNVRHEVRWDTPRADAILRKIADARPDIVMKQGRERNFVLGITSNTDWELARRSPANLWLVNESIDAIDCIVAAIGTPTDDPADLAAATDAELLDTATAVAGSLDAEIYPVNAWQAPIAAGVAAGIGGAVAMPAKEAKALRETTVKRHEAAVKALAGNFDIPTDNVRVCEGRPDVVVPEVADSVGAGLIVLGARSIGRLERVVTKVTVEPLMARSDCDVLVIRDSDAPEPRETATRPFRGVPKVNRDDIRSAKAVLAMRREDPTAKSTTSNRGRA